MQPNEQDPNGQSPQSASNPAPSSPPLPPNTAGAPSPNQYGQQPYSNAPEYLHMEPVQLDSPKPRKKLKFVLVAFVSIVLVCGIGAAIFWFTVQNSSENRYYSALDKMMQVSYVARKITVHSDTTGNSVVVDAKSDFSDPTRPKSTFSYTSKIVDTSDDNSLDTLERDGDIVVLDNGDDFISRITKYQTGGTKPEVTLNQWYKVDNFRDTQLYDPGYTRKSVNNVLSQVVQGNFSDSDRHQLLDLMRARTVYTVHGSQPVKDGDKNYTVYSVSINYKGLKDVRKKLSELLDVDQPSLPYITDSSAKVWVDNTTGLIAKITEEVKRTVDDEFSASNETLYSYPDSVSVSVPTDTARS